MDVEFDVILQAFYFTTSKLFSCKVIVYLVFKMTKSLEVDFNVVSGFNKNKRLLSLLWTKVSHVFTDADKHL